MRELDENIIDLAQEKMSIFTEIDQIEGEMDDTMKAIQALGLITLELEAELEQSWDLVRRTSAEVEEITDKQTVTKENVFAFMSSIEVKVAELLLDTGNQISIPQSFA